jgi:inner membrane protein
MTWKSHIAIATAIALPFNPMAIPIAVIGSTAPDWSEWVLKFFGIRVQHRGATHYLYIPLLIIAFSFIFDYKNLIFWCRYWNN